MGSDDPGTESHSSISSVKVCTMLLSFLPHGVCGTFLNAKDPAESQPGARELSSFWTGHSCLCTETAFQKKSIAAKKS